MTQALALLTMALQLLFAVNNPNVPQALKDQAVSTANLAIKVANTALKQPTPTSSVSTSAITASPAHVLSKVLKVTADRQEIWADDNHFVNFSFQYLVDGKSVPAIISLKSIIPDVFVSPLGVSTDKRFSFSTKVAGNYILKFITDTGIEAQTTIIAKQWPDRKELEIIPIQTSSKIQIIKTDFSTDIPTTLLGSFKVKTNPDVQIKLYYCNFSVNNPPDTFSYKITAGTSESEDKNCYSIRNSYIYTDNDGISKEEFRVYVSGLSFSGSSRGYKSQFYLDDLVVQELATKSVHKATSSLIFDLEASR